MFWYEFKKWIPRLEAIAFGAGLPAWRLVGAVTDGGKEDGNGMGRPGDCQWL